jgi:hypothetical protein
LAKTNTFAYFQREREKKTCFNIDDRSIQHHHHHQPHRQSRPDISAPILLATTLNPNDADAHRTLSAFSAGSILNHLEQVENLENFFLRLCR